MNKLTKCLNCGNNFPLENDYCEFCGADRPVHDENYCINPGCEHYKKVLDDPRKHYCGKCGQLTSFGNYLMKLSIQ
ncbi:MAG: hypothetical protein OSJ73_08305 [Lachnospiraceae bacterium]|nr:hypothetical protein [Lachnospiraceae bacterium]